MTKRILQPLQLLRHYQLLQLLQLLQLIPYFRPKYSFHAGNRQNPGQY